MTPRQFDHLVKRYREELKREDRRSGEVVAAMYNIHTRTEETDPVQDWTNFFTEWKESPTKEPEEQTEEEMFQIMKHFAAAHPEGLSY